MTTALWVACILFIGQGLIAITLRRIVRTFGVYSEKLKTTHDQNLVIRLNLAIQQNEIVAQEIVRRANLKEESA